MSEPITKAVLADPVVKAVIAEQAPGASVVGTQGQLVAAPTTTEEDDRISAGQRVVNLIWENTQMKIALSVVWAAIGVASYLAIRGGTDAQVAAFVFLYGVANLVTGFYFGRTNHQKIGGVVQGR